MTKVYILQLRFQAAENIFINAQVGGDKFTAYPCH